MVGATVYISDTKHATVNEKGIFSIADVPRDTVEVQFVFMGYETLTRTVILNQNTVEMGNVYLKEASKLMDAVLVEAEATAVVMRGDTIQWNSAAYKTNPDADASDLAEKMGFEIDGSTVKVHGDTIKRAYVDGDLFMGEEAMKVLTALPADLVDAMQVFDELPDEDRFSGFNSGQTQRALNVVTKARGKINKTVDITAPVAYGFDTQKLPDGSYQDLYNVSPNLLLMSRKINLRASTNLNNVGASFGGGSGRRGAMSGGRGGSGGSDGGLSTIYGGDLGIGRTWDRDNRISLNYSFNRTETENETKTLREYDPTELFQTRNTLDTTASNNMSQSHNINLNGTYTRGSHQLNLVSRLSFGNGDNDSYSFNQDIRDGELRSITENKTLGTSNSYQINNQLDWVLKIGEKAGRTLNVSANMNLRKNSSDSNQDRNVYTHIDGVETDTYTPLHSTNDSPSQTYTGGISYNEPITERLRLNVNYSLSYTTNDRENIKINTLTGEMDSTSQINYSDQFIQSGRLGISYTNPGIYSMSLGLSYRGVDHDMEYVFPTAKKENQKYNSFVPTFAFNYTISRQKSLRFNYRAQERVPSLSQLSNIIEEGSNPLILSSGNPNLDRQYTHSFEARYNTTNIEKNTNFNANVRASIIQNSILSKTVYIERDSVLTDYNDFSAQAGSELRIPINENGNFNVNADAEYGFTLFKQRIRLTASYGYQETPSYVQDQLYKTTRNNGNFGLSINSNIENIDFRLSSNTGYSVNESTAGTKRETFTQNVSGNVNLLFLERRLVLNTNYSLRYQKNTGTSVGTTTTTNTWSAYLGYRFLKRRTAEVRVEVNDILNQTPNYNYSVSTEYAQERWNIVRGRYIMFRFQYRFRSLDNMANRFSRGEGDGGEERFRMERNRGEGMPGGGRRGEGGFGGGNMGGGGFSGGMGF